MRSSATRTRRATRPSPSRSLDHTKPIKYSERERRLADVLFAAKTKLDSEQIFERFYKDSGFEPPFNARNALTGLLRSLKRKIEENGEPFTLCQSPRRGPHPIEYWIEPVL